jgi:nucleotide-binding universal stress UspA family protein
MQLSSIGTSDASSPPAAIQDLERLWGRQPAMYTRILVPTDGSACSDRAVEHAVMIAKAMGALVTFVFVMDTMSTRQEGVVNVEEAGVALAARGRPILERAENVARAAGVRGEGALVEGTFVDAIAETARSCDLIVMGTHGSGFWKRLTLGSNTQAVLDRLFLPVLVVRSAPGSG